MNSRPGSLKQDPKATLSDGIVPRRVNTRPFPEIVSMKNNFNSPAEKNFPMGSQAGVGGYVADMQLHMTLQAKNLLPSLEEQGETMEALLREAQAAAEKLASRKRS